MRKKIPTFSNLYAYFCLSRERFLRMAQCEKGHTFAELAIVVAIISVVSAITFYNYAISQKQSALNVEAQKIAQSIRRAQNLALSPLSPGAGEAIGGFGAYLSTSASGGDVIIFKDLGISPDNRYDAGEEVETLKLDSDVMILGIESPLGVSRSNLNILYIPPDPTTVFSDGDGAPILSSEAKITVALSEDASRFKTLEISLTGLIEIK